LLVMVEAVLFKTVMLGEDCNPLFKGGNVGCVLVHVCV